MENVAHAFDAAPAGPGGPGGAKPIPRSKRQVVSALMGHNAVMVVCDGRMCQMPAHLADKPAVPLRLGWNLSPPLQDLKLDDVAISATLLFGDNLFPVAIPWRAVYQVVVDGEDCATVWPGDIPDGNRVPERFQPEPEPAATARAARARAEALGWTVLDGNNEDPVPRGELRLAEPEAP